jgi:hypothetical protein
VTDCPKTALGCEDATAVVLGVVPVAADATSMVPNRLAAMRPLRRIGRMTHFFVDVAFIIQIALPNE